VVVVVSILVEVVVSILVDVVEVVLVVEVELVEVKLRQCGGGEAPVAVLKAAVRR
jgi:hypothetical protein